MIIYFVLNWTKRFTVRRGYDRHALRKKTSLTVGWKLAMKSGRVKVTISVLFSSAVPMANSACCGCVSWPQFPEIWVVSAVWDVSQLASSSSVDTDPFFFFPTKQKKIKVKSRHKGSMSAIAEQKKQEEVVFAPGHSPQVMVDPLE